MRGTQTERVIGNFAGFQLVVIDVYLRGPEIWIKGAAVHTARASDSALGTIRSVEHAIQSLPETIESLERDIRETRKRVTELTAQCEQSFEYRDQLSTLLEKQQRIADALDLTKNQASAQLGTAATEDGLPQPEEGVATLREMGFDYDGNST